MSTTDDIKMSLKLLKTIFLLLFYIHVTGCLWYFVGKDDNEWNPPQYTYYAKTETIQNEDRFT